ncbi:alpha/beta hydrolase, partial [Actinomadura sp. GC306]|uniref:alpha/beta hydrolase n=1 Tax=Actinomadura sp. GC306 TaxID=2530367 RepID=UPI0014053A78
MASPSLTRNLEVGHVHIRVNPRRRRCRLVLAPGRGRAARTRPRHRRTGPPLRRRLGGPAGVHETVVRAIGDRTNVIVVGHSFGGFTAPLVCDRVAAKLLVLLTPMIPLPGEAPADYWPNTKYEEGDYDDTIALFYQDVAPELAAEALSRGRDQSEARMSEPSPLKAWPDVPTRVLIGRNDRLFPADFLRRITKERLNIVPDEIDSGHTPALSRPQD